MPSRVAPGGGWAPPVTGNTDGKLPGVIPLDGVEGHHLRKTGLTGRRLDLQLAGDRRPVGAGHFYAYRLMEALVACIS